MAIQTLRTPLHEKHLALHARMVPFAGWDMPIHYPAGIIAEHQAVRAAWGMFDVSHMGRLYFTGAAAGALLDHLITADVAGLQPGQARYGLMCLPDGGILDDVVVLRLPDPPSPRVPEVAEGPGVGFLLVCNASNRGAVRRWVQPHATGREVRVDDRTASTVMIAVQGPQAREKANALLGGRVPALRRFWGAEMDTADGPVLVTRTGYTGEDGYEIISSAPLGQRLWDPLVEAGAVPCGLGARDTLRLEAGLPLHGQDIDTSTNPLEAGLDRFVHLAGTDFIGKAALEAAARAGLKRRLAGLRSSSRGAVPRHEQAILKDGKQVGTVTSGNFAPTLGVSIAMGYLPLALAAPGSVLEVDIRGRSLPMVVTALPFYKRS